MICISSFHSFQLESITALLKNNNIEFVTEEIDDPFYSEKGFNLYVTEKDYQKFWEVYLY